MTSPAMSAADVLGMFSTDDKPREMPIVDPRTKLVIRSEPTEANPLGDPAYILVCCENSSVGDLNARELYERARAEGKKGANGLSYDEIQEFRSARVAKLIRGWRFVNPQTRQVVDFPYTPENALQLVSGPNREWLRSQVEAFAKDDSNFMMG